MGQRLTDSSLYLMESIRATRWQMYQMIIFSGYTRTTNALTLWQNMSRITYKQLILIYIITDSYDYKRNGNEDI